MRRCATTILAALAALVLAAAVAGAQPAPATPAGPPAPVTNLDVQALDNDDGKHLQLAFTRADHGEDLVNTVVLRRKAGSVDATPSFEGKLTALPALKAGELVGDWVQAAVLVAGEDGFRDDVEPDTAYTYAVVEVRVDVDGKPVAASAPTIVGPRAPVASWIHTKRFGYLGIVLVISLLVWIYIQLVRRSPKDVYIRRMPGVDALEDAVGRSTEMGRPVLYVTGLEEIQDIMTIASLLILGHVAELTANYDTELKVANYYPMTMVVAEEIVRTGYANAGRVDAHRPENVLFITAEQFAFAAGVNGIILRDKPATNIFFGKFFGESLLLAETGFTTGAIQIAGTAELPQLPFFIAACDYTLIGEELYATSAYLSREPTLLANLKAGDAFKLMVIGFILIGTAAATAGWFELAPKVFP